MTLCKKRLTDPNSFFRNIFYCSALLRQSSKSRPHHQPHPHYHPNLHLGDPPDQLHHPHLHLGDPPDGSARMPHACASQAFGRRLLGAVGGAQSFQAWREANNLLKSIKAHKVRERNTHAHKIKTMGVRSLKL